MVEYHNNSDTNFSNASVDDARKLFALPDNAGYTALHYAFLPELLTEAPEHNQYSYNRSMLVNGKEMWVKHVKQLMSKLPSLTSEHEHFYAQLMQVQGIDLNVKSQSEETALLLLCKSVSADVAATDLARRLLENGADPNITVGSCAIFTFFFGKI